MSNADDILHHRDVVSAEALEVAGGGIRAAEIAVVTFVGLLVAPPLLTLAVVVAVPAIAVAAVVGAVIGVVVLPTALVRRVPAHHRVHGSTLFLHRVRANLFLRRVRA